MKAFAALYRELDASTSNLVKQAALQFAFGLSALAKRDKMTAPVFRRKAIFNLICKTALPENSLGTAKRHLFTQRLMRLTGKLAKFAHFAHNQHQITSRGQICRRVAWRATA